MRMSRTGMALGITGLGLVGVLVLGTDVAQAAASGVGSLAGTLGSGYGHGQGSGGSGQCDGQGTRCQNTGTTDDCPLGQDGYPWQESHTWRHGVSGGNGYQSGG